jgi:hypothetical protein
LREKSCASEIRLSGGGERGASRYPAQFKHAVADVAILSQMRGSNGFTAAPNHLVDGTTITEIRVKFTAELTKPTGSSIEAMDQGGIDMFHEKGS